MTRTQSGTLFAFLLVDTNNSDYDTIHKGNNYY